MTLHEFLAGLTWVDIGTAFLLTLPARMFVRTLLDRYEKPKKDPTK